MELFASCINEETIRKYFAARHKLDNLLIHEELYWKQPVKAFWLEDGDSNSKLFHAYATTRKKVIKFLI